MTAYSPLRIDSSEFGKSDVMLELQSRIFPIELVLGIPTEYVRTHCFQTERKLSKVQKEVYTSETSYYESLQSVKKQAVACWKL